MTDDKSPLKYTEWHRIGLKLLLSGNKPTAQGLIDARGAGSMTTATAALNEFYADYLPTVLGAATLGAPDEIKDLVAALWTRLATQARTAAAAEFDTERGQLTGQVKRLDAELVEAGSAQQQLAQALEAAQAESARQEARAIGAEGQVHEQRRIVDDLNRALSQAQRDLDRQAGDLAQARAAAADRKAELAALREEHRTAVAGVRAQHREELQRLQTSHHESLQVLRDRGEAAAEEHARALKAQDDAHQALRTEQLQALAAAGEREYGLQKLLAESRADLAVAQEQLDQAGRSIAEGRAERERLGGLVDVLRSSVQSLSARGGSTAARSRRGARVKTESTDPET